MKNTQKLRSLIFSLLVLGSFSAIYAIGVEGVESYVALMSLVTALAFTLCNREINNSLLVIPLIALINNPIAILIIVFVGFNISKSTSRTVLNLLLMAVGLCLTSTLSEDLISLRVGSLLMVIAALARVYYEIRFLRNTEKSSSLSLLALGVTIGKLLLLFSYSEYAPILLIIYILPIVGFGSLVKSEYVDVARIVCVSSVLLSLIPFNIGLSIYIFLEATDIILHGRFPEGALGTYKYTAKLNAFLLLLFVFITTYLFKLDIFVLLSFVTISLLILKYIAGHVAQLTRIHVLNLLQFMIIIYMGYLQWL